MGFIDDLTRYGLLGAGTNAPHGLPSAPAGLLGIDLSRPMIDNADGSFSTERTITIEAGGRHYLIPTIVKGAQLTPQMAVLAWKAGDNPHVGEFGSADEAEKAAVQRSEMIGKARRR